MIDVDGGTIAAHDGSAAAQRALEEAVRVAAAFRTHVTAVRVWRVMTAPRPRSAVSGHVPSMQDFEAATLAALDHDVADLRTSHPEVRIDTAVLHGNPAEQLIAVSESADMMVVGRRGLGGFAQLVLGSVSDQVVRHARCPVLVVNTHAGSAPSPSPPSPSAHERPDLEEALASELKLDR